MSAKPRRPGPSGSFPHRRRRRTASASLAQRPLETTRADALPVVELKTPTGHPLVYRKRIQRVDERAAPGDLVRVVDGGGQHVGVGLYNSKSEIAVRMLHFGSDYDPETFWPTVLQNAVGLRRDLLQLEAQTDAWRVVHAEGDGLPGLVIDKLGPVLSAEAFSLGMFQRAEAILQSLAPLCGTEHAIIRCSPASESQEGFTSPPLRSEGCPSSVTVQEYGTRFRIRFEGGHKTGFFCDQRENRRKLAEFCGGKSVLDLCCYTGGFSVQAKRLGNAAEVIGVDLDQEPLALARENANLNQVRVKFVQADVFAYMRDVLRNGQQFDVVVLDPPKLIRSRAELEEGTRKHFDLNRLAMQLVKPGGLLLSCTCAGLLPEAEFVKLLCSAARQAGPPSSTPFPDGRARHEARPMQLLARTGAAPDHPVASNCPEGEYLNAVWMRMG